MKFHFSGTLLRFVDFQREIQFADADTLGKALDQLSGQYPALQNVLFDNNGRLRSALKMFVNGSQYKTSPPEALHRSLGPGDEVELLTAIAGG